MANREAALGPIPDDILPIQMPNRIPPFATREETRLLNLTDQLLDDFAQWPNAKPSSFALGRLKDRTLAWDKLMRSNPQALVRRNPALEVRTPGTVNPLGEDDSVDDGTYLRYVIDQIYATSVNSRGDSLD